MPPPINQCTHQAPGCVLNGLYEQQIELGEKLRAGGLTAAQEKAIKEQIMLNHGLILKAQENCSRQPAPQPQCLLQTKKKFPGI